MAKKNDSLGKKSLSETADFIFSQLSDDWVRSIELERRLEKEHGITHASFVRSKKILFDEGRIVKDEASSRRSYRIKKADFLDGSKERKVISTSLCLGEMAYGTRAYDPNATTGLATWLKETERTDIDNVFMVGGLLPLIPSFYSVSGSEAMRFLGDDHEKPSSENLEELLANTDLNPSDRAYYEKYIDRKILSYADAIQVVKRELGKLTPLLSGAEWHYQHGEEDRKTIQTAKELMITDAATKRQNLKQYKEEISKLEKRKEQVEENYQLLQHKREIMNYINNRTSQTTKTGQKLKDYLNTVAKDTISKFKLKKEESGEITELLSPISKPKERIEKIKRDVKQIRKQTEGYHEELEESSSRRKDLQDKLDSVHRQLEAWGFFRVTKRVEVKPDEEELFFRLAKTRHNERLYDAFPGNGDKFHVHSSSEKLVESETIDEDELLRVYLAHNPNQLLSNTPTKKDLVMLKDKAKRMVKLKSILGGEIPEVFLSAHGQGGFRFQPQLKYREEIIEGQYVGSPEIVLHIKLPTFQSIPHLEKLVTKGLKNEHTKRYNVGDYSSGAVIHTAYNDGSFDIEYIDVDTLVEFAGIGKKIEAEEAKLKKLSPEKRKETGNKIDALRNKLNPKLEQIEADGDAHLGAPSVPGRPSSYDYVDAIQKYQRGKGLPDVLVISEALHASIPRVVDSNQQYWVALPSRFEELMKTEIDRTDIPAEEKLKRLEQLAKTQNNSIPITHTDSIVLEWKDRCLPYVHEVLAKGGQVIIASGNHYNKSGPGRDEATILSALINSEYDEQVHSLSGRGEQQGLGEVMLPGGKRIYVAHKLRSGKDELLPAFGQIRGAVIDSEIVLCFDRHHTAGGFADGTIYALGPAKQTWNPYVDEIGKLSSPRGTMNLYVPAGKGNENIKYAKWEMVLNPTLEEHYMEKPIKDVKFK